MCRQYVVCALNDAKDKRNPGLQFTTMHAWFPSRSQVACIHIALAANGESSYRDALHVSELSRTQWNATCTVITDRKGLHIPNAVVLWTPDSKQLLHSLTAAVSTDSVHKDIFLVVSAHGYSSGAHQYIMCNGEHITDTQLGNALYSPMHPSCRSLCLLDTCHSGTLLDLRYHTASNGVSIVFTPGTVSGEHIESVVIAACNDQESSEEGISSEGGWGGGLVAELLDAFVPCSHHGDIGLQLNVVAFFKTVHHTFTNKTRIPGNIVGDRSQHPVFSFTERMEPLRYLLL
jgi:hypothetical protein